MSTCYDRYYNRTYTCYDSPWYSWGRWVLLGALVVGFAIVFFLFSCITARRRRKLGRKPLYGTGWVPHGQPTYNPNYQQPPQPLYNSNPTTTYPQGGYHGQNQGYFGGQQTGVEQPQNTYQPPPGPPPPKY